jgi:hypothetical protein
MRRPDDESSEPWSTQVATHFLKSGLELFVGATSGWEECLDATTYDIQTVVDPLAVIRHPVEGG